MAQVEARAATGDPAMTLARLAAAPRDGLTLEPAVKIGDEVSTSPITRCSARDLHTLCDHVTKWVRVECHPGQL